jgi:hypothetical protein
MQSGDSFDQLDQDVTSLSVSAMTEDVTPQRCIGLAPMGRHENVAKRLRLLTN